MIRTNLVPIFAACALARGMLADLIVLDRNPFKIPITQVHDTRVKMTMINGEIVYGAH